jgi:hypothetical protein
LALFDGNGLGPAEIGIILLVLVALLGCWYRPEKDRGDARC